MDFNDPTAGMPRNEDGHVLGFVYGTLRYGFHNYRWYEDCIVEDLGTGTVPGLLYASGIPFLDADGDGEVVGDLFAYDPNHNTFKALARMEMGAGYEWRITKVTLEDGSQVEAGVWHDPRAAQRGDLIPSGDYETYEIERYGSWD